jgi:hypothetical protein
VIPGTSFQFHRLELFVGKHDVVVFLDRMTLDGDGALDGIRVRSFVTTRIRLPVLGLIRLNEISFVVLVAL